MHAVFGNDIGLQKQEKTKLGSLTHVLFSIPPKREVAASSGLIYLIEDGTKLFKTLLEQGKYIFNTNLKL